MLLGHFVVIVTHLSINKQWCPRSRANDKEKGQQYAGSSSAQVSHFAQGHVSLVGYPLPTDAMRVKGLLSSPSVLMTDILTAMILVQLVEIYRAHRAA